MKNADAYVIYNFPCGALKIGYTDTAITGISISDEKAGGTPSPLSELAKTQLCEYFDGKRHEFDLPLELRGTDFQKRVWAALCDIPYGETRSYKDIAKAVSNPKGYRAVGMANNKNPVVIVVPCHRVIGADGSLVGYGGGLDMKRLLLKLEGSTVG
ncbi:MAG: methylated-DNA--[protein]-cysteine S-methyltransferase [Oscillospiraceae bacterium]